MIINIETGQLVTMSTHPHDNWIGEGWLVVPAELEETALALSPFISLTTDEAGEITAITEDTAARAAAEAEKAEQTAE